MMEGSDKEQKHVDRNVHSAWWSCLGPDVRAVCDLTGGCKRRGLDRCHLG